MDSSPKESLLEKFLVNDNEPLAAFLRVFYTFKLAFLGWYFQLYGPSFENFRPNTLFFAEFLSRIIDTNAKLYTFAFLTFFILVANILYPLERKLRIAEAVATLLLSCLLQMTNDFGDSFNLFLMASFFLAFISKQNKNFVIHAVINLCLSIYFVSGIWKLISLVSAVSQRGNLSVFHDFLINHAAKISIRMGVNNSVTTLLAHTPSFIQVLITLSILIFQLFMIYPIVKNKHSGPLGISLILFHFGGQVVLDVNFIEMQIFIALLFFLGLPLTKKQEAICD